MKLSPKKHDNIRANRPDPTKDQVDTRFQEIKTVAPPANIPRNLLFPFKSKPSLSWHDGHRYFGAPRPKGRLHAGCDLMFPVGTPIFAMADGFIMRGPWGFYEHTDALEVCHPSVQLIMRYGELKPGSVPNELRTVGAKVTAGQKVGEVGQLIDNYGHYSSAHMLHIEMYTNWELDSVAHPLTIRTKEGGIMQRRSDVTDPAPILDAAAGVFVTSPSPPRHPHQMHHRHHAQ